MGGRGGSPNPGPQAPAAAAGGDRQWWQDDPVAAAIIQAYVDVHSREHITSLGLMSPGGDSEVGVAVKDVREQMAKHGDNFSRDQFDSTIKRLVRGDGIGTAWGTTFPMGFRARGKDPAEYRRAGFQMGGEEKSFFILTKGSDKFPKPRR